MIMPVAVLVNLFLNIFKTQRHGRHRGYKYFSVFSVPLCFKKYQKRKSTPTPNTLLVREKTSVVVPPPGVLLQSS